MNKDVYLLDTLDQCRRAIDSVDDLLIDLLIRRFEIVHRVIEIKSQNQIPARIASRINEVMERVIDRSRSGVIPSGLVEKLYREIVETTCQYEDDQLPQRFNDRQ